MVILVDNNKKKNNLFYFLIDYFIVFRDLDVIWIECGYVIVFVFFCDLLLDVFII